MQYSPYHPLRKYTSLLSDPLSTTAAALATLGGGSAATGGAMALTGIGAGISAANTMAGGDYAAQVGRMKQAEANFEADQDVGNAAGETGPAGPGAGNTPTRMFCFRGGASRDNEPESIARVARPSVLLGPRERPR